jgi:alpha-methylacyl-CoA racemase
VLQPAPAPRFGGTPAGLDRPPAAPGQHTDEVLSEAGWTTDELAALRATGAIG